MADEAQKAALEFAFKQFDANGDGKLTAKEMEAILSRGESPLSSSQIKDIISMFDTDGDGMLNLQEFIAAMSEASDEEAMSVLVKAAFNAMDQSGSGKITKADLDLVLVQGGLATQEEIAGILGEFDKNANGTMDLTEFSAAVDTMEDSEAMELLKRLKQLQK